MCGGKSACMFRSQYRDVNGFNPRADAPGTFRPDPRVVVELGHSLPPSAMKMTAVYLAKSSKLDKRCELP